MRQIICEGTLTSDPTVENGGPSGTELKFHLSVDCGDNYGDMWFACKMQGRNACEAPEVRKGDIVTISGKPRGIGLYEPQGERPLHVDVKDLILHAGAGDVATVRKVGGASR